MFDYVHRRFNPLTREWVLVSPHRDKHPWQGQVEKVPPVILPPYNPDCYLCPGNERVGGVRNPDYKGTFVFDNDFSALLAENQDAYPKILSDRLLEPEALFNARPESGRCKVVCFSPRHDLTFPQLSLDEAQAVITTWCQETENLQKLPDIEYVQVFENKGALNEHGTR